MNELEYAELTGYGARLTRLRHAEIEMVRRWRISPEVSQYMEFQGEITPEMQEKWFESINNRSHFYYLFHHQDRPIGLVNLKDVDDEERSAEGGIFTGEPVSDPWCGLRAIVLLYEFAFETLGLRFLRAHVRRDNPGAIRLNRMLGMGVVPGQEAILNQEHRLLREDFDRCTAKLRERFRGT